MTLLPAGAAYQFHAGQPERDPAADPGRTRHGRALGRDLPDHAAAPGLSEEDDAMTTDTLPELGSIEPNQHGYRDFTLGKFSFSRDEYFAHVALAQRHPHAPGRRLPPRDPARRRVGVLLRHRQLRHRHRDREPLRHRGSLRGPLQRPVPAGRARLLGELQDRRDQPPLRGDPGRLDERDVRSLRVARGDGQRLRAQERQQQAGDHAAPGDRQAHDRRARATSRSAPTTTASRSTATSPTCRRTRPRCTRSPASSTRWSR